MWSKIEDLIKLSQQQLTNEVDLERNPERRNYYRFLYHLVRWFQPQVALEIGVELGLASTYMTMAAKEYGGWVIGVDLHKPSYLPDNNYHFVEGDSTHPETIIKVSEFCSQRGLIGIVFQDSSHHYLESIAEWTAYSSLLAKPALWICDDITTSFHDPLVDPPGKGMVEYFGLLPPNKRLYKDVLHRGNTQGIVMIG